MGIGSRGKWRWSPGRAASPRLGQRPRYVSDLRKRRRASLSVDRDAEPMKETVARVRDAGGDITTHLCDVTDAKAVAAMVEACIAAYGRIDVLVNNVGGSAAGGPVELSLEGWENQIDYNLTTVFLACKYTLPVMVRQNGGAIVNTSSTSGMRYGGAAQIGYAASRPVSSSFPAHSPCNMPSTASA